MRLDLPTGTISLVFTDIEGSTRLLEELGTERYRQALGRHREVVREAFGRHQGYDSSIESRCARPPPPSRGRVPLRSPPPRLR
jgi:class 3 adenylate cyclase